jgi:hypothetical protein
MIGEHSRRAVSAMLENEDAHGRKISNREIGLAEPGRDRNGAGFLARPAPTKSIPL